MSGWSGSATRDKAWARFDPQSFYSELNDKELADLIRRETEFEW